MSQGGIHRPALLLLEERQSGPRSTGELVEFGDLSEGSTGNGSSSSDALVHGSEFLGLFGFGSFRLGGGLGLTTVQLDRSSTGVTGGSARGIQERVRFRSLWDYGDPRIDSRVSVATVTTSESATSSGGISGQALASVSADHWDIQGGQLGAHLALKQQSGALTVRAPRSGTETGSLQAKQSVDGILLDESEFADSIVEVGADSDETLVDRLDRSL